MQKIIVTCTAQCVHQKSLIQIIDITCIGPKLKINASTVYIDPGLGINADMAYINPISKINFHKLTQKKDLGENK